MADAAYKMTQKVALVNNALASIAAGDCLEGKLVLRTTTVQVDGVTDLSHLVAEVGALQKLQIIRIVWGIMMLTAVLVASAPVENVAANLEMV